MFARASVAEVAHAPEGTFGPTRGPCGPVRRRGVAPCGCVPRCS